MNVFRRNKCTIDTPEICKWSRCIGKLGKPVAYYLGVQRKASAS